MKFENKENTLTLYFEGELNSYNSEEKEKEAEQILNTEKFDKLVLDFLDLRYISSAGLRIILKFKQKHDDLCIINASLEVYDILSMTGFANLIDVKKAMRNFDISNAEVIGEGYFSTVYRIDKDTIIKVFNRTSDPNQIERELKLAKEAFVLGIPTAISYDIVKVGEKLGVRFEMLDCESLKNVVAKDISKAAIYVDKYVELLKKINTTICNDPEIPSIKKFYLEKVEVIKPFIEDKYYQKAKTLIENIEDRNTFVHGDCHFKNIMVEKDELLLIDMDTLSVGHPIFELAAIYAPYVAFPLDDPGNAERFFGIKDEDAKRLFDALVTRYFNKEDQTIIDKIALVSHIHMLWWNRVNEPENKVRLEGVKSRLYAYLDKYDDLNI